MIPHEKNPPPCIQMSDEVILTVSGADRVNDLVVETYYCESQLMTVAVATLAYLGERMKTGVILPYFADMDEALWQQKPKTLDIYITDQEEGCALNAQARGKEYATNVLSYPSDLPAAMFALMPTLPLGELILCHEVIRQEAIAQQKPLSQHIAHLLVHGTLHLLGFDHERGQHEQDEMERFEIAILASMAIPNPYV